MKTARTPRMSSTRLPIWLMTITAFGILCSCSKEYGAEELSPNGLYPLEFTAAKDTGSSMDRAAGKDAWTVGDEIGAKIANGTAGIYKITNTDGTTEAITPAYWQNTAQATVTAWYPKDARNDVSLTNQAQGFTDIDFLKAEESRNYNTTGTLKFKHILAKVHVTLKTTNQTTDLDDAEVSLYGNTAFDYSEGTATGKGSDYLPTFKEGTGADATYEALLVPQTMTETKFIRILLKNQKPYYLTTTPTLVAGGVHNYEVTINDVPVITVNLADIEGETYTAKWDCIINGDANTRYRKNIVIEDGVTVTINNVNIKPNKDASAIYGEGTATLILQGKNTIEAYGNDNAGAMAATKIIIQGDGELKATGMQAAGIGGGPYKRCGDILIEGGTITSTATYSGYLPAGLGSNCGDITITGGNVTAIGVNLPGSAPGYNSSGIGSGRSGEQRCGSITISGGTVTAKGGNYSQYDISGSNNITIKKSAINNDVRIENADKVVHWIEE
ncbi:fimbrillin family protein [Phocaeicola sp.]